MVAIFRSRAVLGIILAGLIIGLAAYRVEPVIVQAGAPIWAPQPDLFSVRQAGIDASDLATGLLEPEIQVAPAELAATLYPGGTITRTLTIRNLGTSELSFDLREEEPVSSASLNFQTGGRPEPAVTGVEQQILDEMAAAPDGQTGFFVAFEQTADLSPAYRMDWTGRGRYVVQALQTAAESAQAEARGWLEAQGIPYTPYWINNTLYVRGSQDLMEQLGGVPGVAGFSANHHYQIQPASARELSLPVPAAAVPWNISATGAYRVHSELVQYGDGILIGGIDSGVDYDHKSLVSSYRGYLGEGVFDHTYSWYDPGADDCSGQSPCDTSDHGTGTHGIMTGSDDPVLPSGAWVGMAPGAKWIHCLGLPGGSGVDTELIECAQWMLAPGGDPDQRPQVVNHSWGSQEPNSCGGNWFASTLEAYRAADILPAFAAGNLGALVMPLYCNSSTSPANSTDSNGNPLAFASGAYGMNGLLDSYSSCGPNACNPDRLFPDLVAPGLGSCTTLPDDQYTCSFGGTSAASPHTAGCAALIWSSLPWLNVSEVEQLLRDSAVDVENLSCGGNADWNNLYGEGRLDCYSAVSQALEMDVEWLVESPMSGSLRGSESGVVEVRFTVGFDAEPGVYSGTLVVLSNDESTSAIKVPVSLTVLEPLVAVSGDLEGSGWAGGKVTYRLQVSNQSKQVETFNLFLSEETWPASLTTQTVTLDPGESAGIGVTVMIPRDALFGGVVVHRLQAVSPRTPEARMDVELVTAAGVRRLILPFVER